MKITQVTVTIHEKRNNPFAYGHYDATVSLTADLVPNDIYETAIQTLQTTARQYVLEECDRWEHQLRALTRIGELTDAIQETINRIGRTRKADMVDQHAADCEELIHSLPADLQREWLDDLAQAVQEALDKLEVKDDNEQSD